MECVIINAHSLSRSRAMTQEKSFDELKCEIDKAASDFMDVLDQKGVSSHPFHVYQAHVNMALKRLEKRISELESSS